MLWCKTCGQAVNSKEHPGCEGIAQADIPTQIQWCGFCNITIIKEVSDKSIDICPLCKGKTIYSCSDIRPCFPAERLLFEIIKGCPMKYKNSSVWVNNNKYYIDGKVFNLETNELSQLDVIKTSSMTGRKVKWMASQVPMTKSAVI